MVNERLAIGKLLMYIYDYLIEGQKILGWSSEIYWVTTISIVLVLGGGVGFYVFGKNILKWINKRKKN